ncbi:hypothetical protein ScalyP_jg1952, partial [Parmales sp. scaly parma]
YTKTKTHHTKIQSFITDSCPNKSFNLQLIAIDDNKPPTPKLQSTRVLFSAPPGKFTDYPKAVESVLSSHLLPSPSSRFLFTSSGSVFPQKSKETVTESSPTFDPHIEQIPDRIAKLLEAENLVTSNDAGVVIRLAGLYLPNRGAHSYWLRPDVTKVNSSGDGLINLLHYDDAAAAVVKVLDVECSSRNKLFIVSDGNPLTRTEICQVAIDKGQDGSTPSFAETTPESDLGKVYDCSKIKSTGWTPRIPKFADCFTKSLEDYKMLFTGLPIPELKNWALLLDINVEGVKGIYVNRLASHMAKNPGDFESLSSRLKNMESEALRTILSLNDPIPGPSSLNRK